MSGKETGGHFGNEFFFAVLLVTEAVFDVTIKAAVVARPTAQLVISR